MVSLRLAFFTLLWGHLGAQKDAEDWFWVGPTYWYTWKDSVCTILSSFPQKHLDDCKASCAAHAKCTAIHQPRSGQPGLCVLRGCPMPVPTPDHPTRHDDIQYTGYYMRNSGNVKCHSGEKRQVLDDGTHICETGSPEKVSYYDPVPPQDVWDRDLPRFGDCWDGIESGRLKRLTWGIKIAPSWVAHFEEHQADFKRHGYPTLKESPGLLIDPVSYLFEQQFGVRLVIGKVVLVDEDGYSPEGEPWLEGYAGMMYLDLYKASAGSGICRASQSFQLVNRPPFNQRGELEYFPLQVAAHEFGHAFGSPHTPVHKPDIMVVDGGPTYRRCNGRPCLYRHFLPWDDDYSYHTNICKKHIQTEKCSVLVDPSDVWTTTTTTGGPPPVRSAWRIVTPTTHSGWLWGVRHVKFSTRNGELNPTSSSTCTILQGVLSHNAPNAFNDARHVAWLYKWNGAFYIGIECSDPSLEITQVKAHQFSEQKHWASTIKVQKLNARLGTWEDVAVASDLPKDGEVTLYESSAATTTATTPRFPWLDLSGKVATQSSTAYGGVATRAIDSDTNSNWFEGTCTATQHEANPWWQVDLGSKQAVKMVKITNRGDCCGDRLSPFSVSIDGVVCASSVTIGQGEIKEVVCEGVGQTLRVEPGKPTHLTICDFQVAAEATIAPSTTTTTTSVRHIEGLSLDEAAAYNPHLSSYWDHSHCGKAGNNQNWAWCNTGLGMSWTFACQQRVSVDSSVCSSGVAERRFTKNFAKVDGCWFAYYQQYACAQEPESEFEPGHNRLLLLV